MATHDEEGLPRSRRDLQGRPRAVVVGVQLPGVDDVEFEASLIELERLGTTLGLLPITRITQKRSALAPAAVLGEGKLVELASWTGGTGIVPSGAPQKKKRKIDQADDEPEDEAEEAGAVAPTGEPRATVVLVDHDLAPSQALNLERATGAEVLDRTSVIVSIFQRHARTREARIQVEIARLTYLAPRLREAGAGGDRQRGGIGGKGAGESAVELDRRRIRDRIAELRNELSQVQRESDVRRARRVQRGDTFALVGYTNAGKSSWFRMLTGGEVYVADELFATLDTTVRALAPETRPRILVSDTVGFIDRLPHDLVASFRSTLEEARDASLLVHVVDASDPAFRAQLDVTKRVLAEIDADQAPSLVLLNKVDRIDAQAREALAIEYPDAMQVSARSKDDVATVRERIVAFFERDMVEDELFVPYAKSAIVNRVHESARVLDETHEDEGTRLKVRAPAAVLAQLRAQL
ncbi:GTPase HflX [Sandaracinus amylolyticus]|uniref:GTPase HflX n=1 Tax=Sandaracinus amylolyticus TaxID=927083 RepID=A0A0F6W6I9_9BACT|nr:GTPase HflX [Sandaracinus amylolyticus]AKF08775.1 GTP-binding protein related to HflX [Sandaracinus amylolyticus]